MVVINEDEKEEDEVDDTSSSYYSDDNHSQVEIEKGPPALEYIPYSVVENV